MIIKFHFKFLNYFYFLWLIASFSSAIISILSRANHLYLENREKDKYFNQNLFYFRAEQLYLDPLADRQLPSIAFRHGPPSITSILALEPKPDSLYQRSSRHYIGFFFLAFFNYFELFNQKSFQFFARIALRLWCSTPRDNTSTGWSLTFRRKRWPTETSQTMPFQSPSIRCHFSLSQEIVFLCCLCSSDSPQGPWNLMKCPISSTLITHSDRPNAVDIACTGREW